MIILDNYKIEKDVHDYSLWELREKKKNTKAKKGNKSTTEITDKTAKGWFHIGYYRTPFLALSRLLRLESYGGFDDMGSVGDLVVRVNDLYCLVDSEIEKWVRKICNER